MKKMLILAIVAIVGIAIAVVAVVMVSKTKKLNAFMDTVQIGEVDLAGIADGTYAAAIDAGLIQVAVEATVSDHVITKIDLLKHKSGQGGAAGAITDGIIREQKIAVDAISGATLSSRVIQKAVETALSGVPLATP